VGHERLLAPPAVDGMVLLLFLGADLKVHRF